jgi:hypothetical protein
MKLLINIKVLILLIICNLFLASCQIILINFYSTFGEKLSELKIQTEKIEDDNTLISQKIASSSSLLAISIKAKESGLIDNTSIIHLSEPQPIAFSDSNQF